MIKDNPEQLEKLESDVIRLREMAHRAEDLVSLTEQPGWTEFMDRFIERLRSIELELDNFEKLSPEGRTLLLKERSDFRRIVNMAGDITSDLPKLYAELKNTESKLNERKSRHTTIHP